MGKHRAHTCLPGVQRHVLLNVPGKQRQVENQSQPVAVDQKQEGQETVHSSLGDDVGVQAVAEVDGVDVVTVVGVDRLA